MFNIVRIENPSEEDYGIIYHGMNEYASQHDMPGTGGYFFVVYDQNKAVIAAISGFDNFGPTEIGGLWVAKEYRTQGYGKSLVLKAEEWGKEKGCKAITVFTIKEWPAFKFYQHLGFKVEFERKGHVKDTTGCYLIKQLT